MPEAKLTERLGALRGMTVGFAEQLLASAEGLVPGAKLTERLGVIEVWGVVEVMVVVVVVVVAEESYNYPCSKLFNGRIQTETRGISILALYTLVATHVFLVNPVLPFEETMELSARNKAHV